MLEKRAYVTLTGRLVADLIFAGSQFEGADILNFVFDPDKNVWAIQFVHDSLPEVPEAAETPEVTPKWYEKEEEGGKDD